MSQNVGGGSGVGPCHKKTTVSKSFLSHLKHFLRLLFFRGRGGGGTARKGPLIGVMGEGQRSEGGSGG